MAQKSRITRTDILRIILKLEAIIQRVKTTIYSEHGKNKDLIDDMNTTVRELEFLERNI